MKKCAFIEGVHFEMLGWAICSGGGVVVRSEGKADLIYYKLLSPMI